MGNLPWSPKNRRECWIFSMFCSGEARQTPHRHPSTEHRPVPPPFPPAPSRSFTPASGASYHRFSLFSHFPASVGCSAS